MDKRKKRIIALILSLFFLGTPTYEGKEKSDEVITMSNINAFRTYSKGLVYIGNKELLKKIKPNDGDILVLDCRNSTDPNMKIFSSYRIDDNETRKEILKILLEYEFEHPSNWNRSFTSMQIEWYFHNLLYFFGYRLDRTTDVDLNNNDEEIYKDIFKEILKFNMKKIK